MGLSGTRNGGFRAANFSDRPAEKGRTPTVVVRYRLSLFFEKEPVKDQFIATEPHREAWNKGKLAGEKTPLEGERHLGDPRSPGALSA
jgi:hypothetical protein